MGGEELIQQIMDTKGGCIDFDKCIATPDLMKPLAKIGKILGPKGMMPNPKVGTLTTNVAETLEEMKQGRIEFKVDRTAIVHVPLGKVRGPRCCLHRPLVNDLPFLCMWIVPFGLVHGSLYATIVLQHCSFFQVVHLANNIFMVTMLNSSIVVKCPECLFVRCTMRL